MINNEFSDLFDKLDIPVIAVFDGKAVYCNPAAQAEVGDLTGTVLSDFSDETGTASFNGKAYTVTVGTAFDHSIYYLSPKYTADDLLYHTSARLKEKIAELKLSESILVPMIENIDDKKLTSLTQSISKTIATLHRMAGNLGYFQSFDKTAFFPVTFDIAQVISDIVHSVPVFVGDNCPEIVFEQGNGDMTIQADKGKIEMALFQLLANSLKHTQKNGRITIRLSRTSKSFSITVSDNGCGISSAKLTSIWSVGNPEISPNGGIGVGLPIVQHIAALHGGHAIISSNKNGTVVSISIPATNENADNLNNPAARYDSGLGDLMLQLSEVIPPEHFCSKFTD